MPCLGYFDIVCWTLLLADTREGGGIFSTHLEMGREALEDIDFVLGLALLTSI